METKLDTSRARELINSSGTELERVHFDIIFNNAQRSDEAVEVIEGDELESGGFSYGFDKSKPFSMGYTLDRLGQMIELDLKGTPVFQRTKNLVLSMQSEDGFFDENPELSKFDHHPFYIPGEMSTRTWMTGEAIRLIARDGEHENPSLKKATEYLLSNYDEREGRIKGYDIASCLTLASMAWTQTENFEVMKKLSETCGEIVSREKDHYLLAWEMDTMIESSHMEGVFICLRSLQLGQNLVGLWESELFHDRPARTNLAVLKQLRWGKRW